ncbi:MAG: amino acid adenylation domain-containing protein [Chloroflexota bacterium]
MSETHRPSSTIDTQQAASIEEKRRLLAQLLQAQAEQPQFYPPSATQKRLWLLEQLGTNNAYNMPGVLRLCGALNVAVLERVLQEITRRHVTLRTTFMMHEENLVQKIHPAAFELPIIDLRAKNASKQETEVNQLIHAEINHHFDLMQGPLFRAILIQVTPQQVTPQQVTPQQVTPQPIPSGEQSIAGGEHTQHVDEYLLLVNMHHIVSDGWSMQVFFQELTTLYTAFVQGQPSPLAELPIQYTDFALWQQEQLTEKMLATQLSYWQEQLQDALPLLELPIDRPRPPMQTYAGSHYLFTLPSELSRQLNELGKRTGTTRFMTLLAAFKVLLMRYSGQEDIIVGSPTTGRNRAELEPLIGFFVNILAMRSDLSGPLTFRELLQQLKATILDAYRHQEVPLEQIIEHVQPERNPNHAPLFQVVFELLNGAFLTVKLPGVTVENVELETPIAKFDMSLSIFEDAVPDDVDALMGRLEYNTDLYDKTTIERMMAHFEALLQGVVANPDQSIHTLPLLTEAEQNQFRVEWNRPHTNCTPRQCIHQLFEEQVARTPDAVALRFADQQLTYQQLNQRANQLAHYLRGLGVAPEILVGILVERSIEMVVGILGILKAGGAYVPLDPAHPQERLQFMLDDAAVSVLLVQKELQDHLSLVTAQTVYLDSDGLDSDWQQIQQQSEQNLDHDTQVGIQPDNLAYVIYTSGSSGTPKGVLVQHNNVARLLQATQPWFHFDEHDVWTLFHTYAFDFSVWELWGALLYGGQLVIVPHAVSRSAESFYQLLCDQGVTVLNQTPSAFYQLMSLEASLTERGTLPEKGTLPDTLALRYVIFGGEALDFARLQPWFEQHGDDSPQLINMYGITETTVHVTYRPVTQADVTQSASLIGEPIPDLQLYILDAYQQPVPIGVAGELYVGGPGVSRGYLNLPELTAERFVTIDDLRIGQANHQADHQVDHQNNQKLYRTGDLVRRLPNSEIEYLGRIDDQVKLRGFRIELSEIETRLVGHESIQEAVVTMQEIDDTDKRLVAYFVGTSTIADISRSDVSPSDVSHSDVSHSDVSHSDISPSDVSHSDLRTYLAQTLPEYMIPSAFVQLEAMPLTPNGKINRRALPAPEAQLDETDLMLPRTETEELLTGIWKEILNIEHIGVHSNFFDMGFHSLLAVKAITLISEQLDLDVPLNVLFDRRSIAALAEWVTLAQTDEDEMDAILADIDELSEEEIQALLDAA